MSYDLAFWEGARPTTDDEALRLFEELFDELEDLDEDIPPTPTIEALVRELEARWPIDHPDAPWASFPLADDAQGSALYVNLVCPSRTQWWRKCHASQPATMSSASTRSSSHCSDRVSSEPVATPSLARVVCGGRTQGERALRRPITSAHVVLASWAASGC